MERPANNELNHCWSMDFVQDALFNGQKFRSLTIVDNFSRYWTMEVNLYPKYLTGGHMIQRCSGLPQAWQTYRQSFIESFNESFGDECLDVNWFLSLDDSYENISGWAKENNNFRPHSSLNDLTPQQVVERYLEDEP